MLDEKNNHPAQYTEFTAHIPDSHNYFFNDQHQ